MPETKDIKTQESPKRSFTLHYKYLGDGPFTKHFEFKGTLRDAIQRGKDHCTSMGYGFVLVKPFIVDLDHQERLKNSDDVFDDENAAHERTMGVRRQL